MLLKVIAVLTYIIACGSSFPLAIGYFAVWSVQCQMRYHCLFFVFLFCSICFYAMKESLPMNGHL